MNEYERVSYIISHPVLVVVANLLANLLWVLVLRDEYIDRCCAGGLWTLYFVLSTSIIVRSYRMRYEVYNILFLFFRRRHLDYIIFFFPAETSASAFMHAFIYFFCLCFIKKTRVKTRIL